MEGFEFLTAVLLEIAVAISAHLMNAFKKPSLMQLSHISMRPRTYSGRIR
jgi:hypothetical protein